MCLSLMVAGMSLDARAAIENQDAFEKSCFSVGVSSLNAVVIRAMSFDFDFPRAVIGQLGQRLLSPLKRLPGWE